MKSLLIICCLFVFMQLYYYGLIWINPGTKKTKKQKNQKNKKTKDSKTSLITGVVAKSLFFLFFFFGFLFFLVLFALPPQRKGSSLKVQGPPFSECPPPLAKL